MQTVLSENFWYDPEEEGLPISEDAGIDHTVRDQHDDLYFPLYDHWKVFIGETACGLDFSDIPVIGDIIGISILV